MAYAYFDHNATSTLDSRVRDAMLPWLQADHGNPSSLHRWGQATRAAIEEAREQVAALLGAAPLEVVFTASGTEANNAVLATVGREHRSQGHVVITSLEHSSVRRGAELLAERGMAVTIVDPEPGTGSVDAERLIGALRPDTRLVALMLANNEVGTLQPVAAVAAACRARGVPLLCDAVQAAGKIEVDCRQLGASFVTVGAHKFHGPLGAAALWIDPATPFSALLVGGSQERRRRASTENAPAIVGFGEACRLARLELADRRTHLAALRERFEAGLTAIADAVVHFPVAPRLPHTSHVAFRGVEGEALLIRLDIAGFAVSTGPACSSGTPEPSKVLLALGIGREEALSSLRVSFGLPNTLAEVDAFLLALAREVAALRAARAPRSKPAVAAQAAAR
jgi:cysteine desulfurase